MAQFTEYRSTDASAPVLTGEVDKLNDLLYACLVTGYGAKAGAGWTRAYDGVNKSAFRQGGGNQFYLQVRDDGDTIGANYAEIRGYEAMSDVDTGTGPFPTTAQLAVNVPRWKKSNSADATARPWIVFADDRTVYLFVDAASNGIYWIGVFGDFYSYVSGDSYRTLIVTTSSTNNYFYQLAVGWAAQTGHYFSRGYTGTGGSVQFGKFNLAYAFSDGTGFAGTLAYPNPADGGFFTYPVLVGEATTGAVNHCRGHLRGLWIGLHPNATVTNGDTISGTGTLTGKTFKIIKQIDASGYYCLIETSNTLDTN